MKLKITTLAIAALFGGLTACSDAPKDVDATEESEEHDEHAGHDHGPGEGHDEGGEVPEALQGLDAGDLALVQAQVNCPVSGEALGSMGAPIKKEVDGKVAFLCCKSCNKKFDADPGTYLAKAAGD